MVGASSCRRSVSVCQEAAAMKTLRSNKRVESDAVKQRAVSCCLRARAAHAQR